MLNRSRVVALGAVALAGSLSIGPTAIQANAAPASMTGTVYAASGAVLGGATVTAYQVVGHAPASPSDYVLWTPAAKTVTTSNGGFTLSGLSSTGTYRLKAVPPDLSTSSYGYWVDPTHITPWIALATSVAPQPNVQFRLGQPASFSGRVTDLRSGKGISGVEVRAMSAGDYAVTGDSQGPGGPSYSWDYSSTLSDQKGYYTLRGLPKYPATLTPEEAIYGPEFTDPSGSHGGWMWWMSYIGGPAYTPEVNTNTETNAVRNIQLGVSGTVRVHVTDAATGRPVAGLSVQPDSAFVYPYTLTNAKGDAYVGGMGGSNSVTVFVTDPMGPAHPAAGTYRTTFYGQSPNWGGATKFLVPDGKTVTVNIAVTRDAAAITGTTMPGGMISSYRQDQLPPPDNGDLQWKLNVGTASPVFADGYFTITGLWPGQALTVVSNSTNSSTNVAPLTANALFDIGAI